MRVVGGESSEGRDMFSDSVGGVERLERAEMGGGSSVKKGKRVYRQRDMRGQWRRQRDIKGGGLDGRGGCRRGGPQGGG